MTKMSRRRKQTLAQMRYEKDFIWRMDRFSIAVAKAWAPMNKALSEVYARARIKLEEQSK